MVVNTLPYGALRRWVRRGDDVFWGQAKPGRSRLGMTVSRQAVCGLARGCAWAMQVPCVSVGLCVCWCVCNVLRLNDVVATRSSAAFNDENVELVSTVVGGDVTPWCERARAWLFGRLR
jgi:hypothetical protein